MTNKFNLSEQEIQDLINHGFATVEGVPLTTFGARERILENAIKHIRRTHMNTRAWTLSTADEQAIDILQSLVEGVPLAELIIAKLQRVVDYLRDRPQGNFSVADDSRIFDHSVRCLWGAIKELGAVSNAPQTVD
jgi:hypothetical protein